MCVLCSEQDEHVGVCWGSGLGRCILGAGARDEGGTNVYTGDSEVGNFIAVGTIVV